MAGTLGRLLDGTPPAWLRALETRVICRTFAQALEVGPPTLRGLSAEAALRRLHAFTAAELGAARASGDASRVRQRLGVRARRLGAVIRRVLPLSQANRQRLVRYLYRGIRIEVEGAMPGELRFGPCSFAQAYTPAHCALMSAFDEGFICGVVGIEGSLSFVCRLTEGAACCRAHIG